MDAIITNYNLSCQEKEETMAIKRLIVVLVLVQAQPKQMSQLQMIQMYLQNRAGQRECVVKVIEHKTCVETENLSKQNFFITWLTDEKYQNSVVLIFMGILENL